MYFPLEFPWGPQESYRPHKRAYAVNINDWKPVNQHEAGFGHVSPGDWWSEPGCYLKQGDQPEILRSACGFTSCFIHQRCRDIV